MLGDWKRDCRSRTLVDSALAGSQALASFFSAPMSLFDSGKATTTTTSQKPTTSNLVQLPAGISAILLALLIDAPWPPAAACPAPVHPHATTGPQRDARAHQGHAWQQRPAVSKKAPNRSARAAARAFRSPVRHPELPGQADV